MKTLIWFGLGMVAFFLLLTFGTTLKFVKQIKITMDKMAAEREAAAQNSHGGEQTTTTMSKS